MALTRARVIAGDIGLAADVDAAIATIIESPRDAQKTLSDIAEMRARVAGAKAKDDPWELKAARGGLMDIEFVAQAGALINGLSGGDPPGVMLGRLGDSGWLSPNDHTALKKALTTLTTVQQISRIALDGELTPDRAGEGLRQALTRAVDVGNFDALAARLKEVERNAEKAVTNILGS